MTAERLETVVEDYAAVLRLHGRDRLPRIILGGQAVNVWAERYLRDERELQPFAPFTSKDLDLLGDHRDLDELAETTGYKKLPSAKKIFIPTAGVLETQGTGSGKPLKIEVLKRLYGVTNEEVTTTALLIERRGLQLRVVHPITLLKAKLENAMRLPQIRRQDVKHLKIMVLAVRGFLREKIKNVDEGTLSERACIGLLESVLKLAMTPLAENASVKHDILWLDAFPLAELSASHSAKLKNFSQKRLAKWKTQ